MPPKSTPKATAAAAKTKKVMYMMVVHAVVLFSFSQVLLLVYRPADILRPC